MGTLFSVVHPYQHEPLLHTSRVLFTRQITMNVIHLVISVIILYAGVVKTIQVQNEKVGNL